MAAAIGFMIIGLLFYFLKYGFNRVVLKKSKDQIELEELVDEQYELIHNKSLFTSKEKNDKKIAELEEKINILRSRVKLS